MSKKVTLSLLSCLTVLLIFSCAKKYQSSSATQLAATHKIIAIVPPYINSYPSSGEQAMRESTNFQQTLYSWLFSRRTLNQLSVDILGVQETNNLLENAGYFLGNTPTPIQLCKILNVDGILTSHYSSTSKMSDAESLALGTVLGLASGNAGMARPSPGGAGSTLEIYDGKTGEMIWSYSQKKSVYVTGPKNSSRASEQKALYDMMKSASKNMPYSM